MIHRCALVRATCAPDPAMPFSMANISLDDAQAQRNLDPIYVSPKHDKEWIVDRTIAVANKLGPDRVLRVDPQLPAATRGVKAELIDVPERGRKLEAPIGLDGRFSFAAICPGPYRVTATSPSGSARISLFVVPDRITRLDLALQPRPVRLGAIVRDAAGRPLVHTAVRLRDPRSGEVHIATTDANGVFVVRNVDPGDYELIDGSAVVRRVTVGSLDPE